LIKYLQDKGFGQISDTMDSYIELWKSWYQGYVKDFHSYTIWNGQKRIPRTMASLQLGKTICETWANLLFNEKCSIVIDDKATDEFINQVFDDNNFWIKINESQEQKAALGTVCYIPYAKGVSVERNGAIIGADRIVMNYVNAEKIKPLSWENGVINELAVMSAHTVGGIKYIYMQLFLLGDDGNYVTENHIFKEDGFVEYELTDVQGFENIPPFVNSGSPIKPFVIDRLNIANNIDMDSPFGISVFANAIDSMKLCDTIFDSSRNEFVLGRKRVMVTAEALKIGNGEPTFDPNDIAYYAIESKSTQADREPFVKELNTDLRTTEHQEALQQGLNTFSSQCGLGENYYRYNADGAATATQVISENNTMFRTLKKHEIILEAVLVDLIRLIINIGKNILKEPLNEDAKITIQFDDSVIEDKNAEWVRLMQEASAGFISREFYLGKRYGVTEEDAREMMPKASEREY